MVAVNFILKGVDSTLPGSDNSFDIFDIFSQSSPVEYELTAFYNILVL